MSVQTFEFHPGEFHPGAVSDDPLVGETMHLNVGPQHPATHGVLRLKIELDGETMRHIEPVVGYLHRGKEKLCEGLGWARFLPHTDRLAVRGGSPRSCPQGAYLRRP